MTKYIIKLNKQQENEHSDCNMPKDFQGQFIEEDILMINQYMKIMINIVMH